jgi:hypothetical protein
VFVLRNTAAAGEPAKPGLAGFGREAAKSHKRLSKKARQPDTLGVDLGLARPPRSSLDFIEKHVQ